MIDSTAAEEGILIEDITVKTPRRPRRLRARRPELTVEQILQWADAHYLREGRWPKRTSGKVKGALHETWSAIHSALWLGCRGLSGGNTLARLLAQHRGVRNHRDLPRLTQRQILQWADSHHRRTAAWPKRTSGIVVDSPAETWQAIDVALHHGLRGLRGGSSLARLLAQQRGVRNHMGLAALRVGQILAWADALHLRTGRWPHADEGAISEAPGETWAIVDSALQFGTRGLPGGNSLARLLARKRRVRNWKDLPPLTIKLVLGWADRHRQRTGRWPTKSCGPVWVAPGETWAAIDMNLREGFRGLPGGSSLYRLLLENGRVEDRYWDRATFRQEHLHFADKT